MKHASGANIKNSILVYMISFIDTHINDAMINELFAISKCNTFWDTVYFQKRGQKRCD